MIILGGADLAHNLEFGTLKEADEYAREVEGECEVVKVDVVRRYPRLLTEEQRDELLDEDLLQVEVGCLDKHDFWDMNLERWDRIDDEEFIADLLSNDVAGFIKDEGEEEFRKRFGAFPGLADKVIERMVK